MMCGQDTEEERDKLRVRIARQSRPSCVLHEMRLSDLASDLASEESVLGTIHLDLALYHEASRFQVSIVTNSKN